MKERKHSMALRMAADQEQEDDSIPLRDSLILRALDEGNSPADVAEALELTPQAVYRVGERHASKRERHQGAGADLRATADALERFTDPRGFERLVVILIGDVDPAAIPLGGVGDSGRDAANADSSTIFTISLAENWQRKVRSDLARIAEAGFEPERVYAVTNRLTTRQSEEKLAGEARAAGIELTVLGQDWLVAKLSEPRHLHLRGAHLGLGPPRGKSFLSAGKYRALLDGRPHLGGLSVEFVGRGREIERALEILDRQKSVLLCGAGGLGKTRLALEMAARDGGEWHFIDAGMQFGPESIGELFVTPKLVVAIDNAHRREDLESLLGALELLEHRPRVVLISRPNFEDKLNQALAGSWLGPVGAERTVRVGPLRWQEMAEILKAPPLEIESGPQRGQLIQLAEGNAQIAIIGAQVAKQRRSVVDLSSDELLQRYIGYLIPSTIAADSDVRRQRGLLAMLAALDGIDSDDTELIEEVGGALRIGAGQVHDGLEQLAETGLVVGERRRYRIKPDLLAEHVLYALTLTEKWRLEIDYATIFERFGGRYLDRLVKALGALPASIFDGEARARLRGLETALEDFVREGPPEHAARMIRDVCRALPELGQRLALRLLERVGDSGEPVAKDLVATLRDAAMRIADFPRSWRLLLRLGAECAGQPEAMALVGEAMADTYQRLPEDDASSGAVLAWVQDKLAEETERFWARRGPGAAGAVALALRPMLTLSFESHRADPDNPMALRIGTHILPESEYTERVLASGGRMAAAIFGELEPAGQLKLLETAGWTAHTAAGFPMSMGRRASLTGRALLDQALAELDVVLADTFEELEMPVRAAAYDYLLKRARYSRKLAAELAEETPKPARRDGIGGPVEPPLPGPELEEYVFMIHNRELGPPDAERDSIKEEYERKMAQAHEVADGLRGEDEWQANLDRWSEWWRQRRELEEDARLGPAPAMVFEALAREDVAFAADAIDHLIRSGSELHSATAVAMGWVVAAGERDRWERWLEAGAEIRATLAAALANCDEQTAGEAMRRLAFDAEPEVRRAAATALAFSASLEDWRLNLGLEAVVVEPDIEAVNRLLRMADQHAKEAGAEICELDRTQLELVERAVLLTARSARLEGYTLASALERAALQLPGLPMQWVWARLDELDLMGRKRIDLRRWDIDFLPEEIEGLVREGGTAEDLSRACERFVEFEDRSPAIPDTAKLIGWLGAGADEVTELIVRLLEIPDRGSRVKAYLLELPLPPEDLDRRALAIASSVEEPDAILLDLIDGVLPDSWSGSYVPHLEQGLAHAERWAGSKNSRLREASRRAIDFYRRRIESWKLDEELEDREYEYGRR